MKKILSIALIFLVVSCNSGKKKSDSHDMQEHSNLSESEKIISLMHQPMMDQSFQKSDNPDIDFLVNMMPHHQGAVDSSEEYIKVSTNPEIKAFAEKIIADQKHEIEEFKGLISELTAKSLDYSDQNLEEFKNKSVLLMDNMMAMMSTVPITDSIDKDYLLAMNYHHQGAVDQSKLILTVTKDEKIKEIAHRIVTAQEKEIAQINEFIEKMNI